MATTASISAPDVRRLTLATAAVLAVGSLGDFLFWDSRPGVSIGLFAGAIASGLVAMGKRTPLGLAALGLLLASCGQSAVELCFTNIASLALLLLIVSGEAAFPGLASGWARWTEALASFLTGPLRWFGFIGAWMETRVATSGREHLSQARLGRLLAAALPATIVAVVFAALLSAGNAVLAEGFARIGTQLQAWLAELSIGRTACWLLWLNVGLALFWPALAPSVPRWWTHAIPRWQRSDRAIAVWQTALLLIAVNGLFFAANTADAFYLWRDAKLPAGVNPSQFLHEGVQALIAAVILAAVLLAALFQQSENVAQHRLLRLLALGWIGQNIVLIAGVLRRLELYVAAYQLSELRIYVGCFLLLVTIGFALLAWHVWRGLNLARLIQQNLAATLALFFVLQFCDVGTWVANWNVARWQADRKRPLDLAYLASLGPRGWLALDEVARDTRDLSLSIRANFILREQAAAQEAMVSSRDWRAMQARRDSRAVWLMQRHLLSP